MLQIKEAKKTFFKSKEHYLEFLSAWKQCANLEADKRPTPNHYIIYALLRGYPENHGFTPITSKRKLDNGRRPNEAEHSARNSTIWACKYRETSALEYLLRPFGKTVDPEHLLIIAKMLQTYDGPVTVQAFAPIFDVQVPNGV